MSDLALIFQPGILSHPIHAMRPQDHVLSQQVLEFLIEHQDNFLIGMQLVSTIHVMADKQKPKRQKREATPTPASSPPTSPLASPPDLQPSSPAAPPLVRADSDLMLPSDSDDEAPAGGYYVIETTVRPDPVSPASPPTSPASTPMTSLEANLLPFKPSRPSTNLPVATRPVVETIEPSDSDEDAPPGGYQVHISDPRARAALLARPTTTRRSESRTSEVASSVSRRKTAPSRRVGTTTRTRRHAKEAP